MSNVRLSWIPATELHTRGLYLSPMNKILQYIWAGLWMSFGAELSFFALWLAWRLLHSRIAHRLDPGHWFHKLTEYFE